MSATAGFPAPRHGVSAACADAGMRCHAVPMDPLDTVRRYAEAWQANDIDAVLASYHDDFVLHYFGEMLLLAITSAGMPHRGADGGDDPDAPPARRDQGRARRRPFTAIVAREGVGDPVQIFVRRLVLLGVRAASLQILAVRRRPAPDRPPVRTPHDSGVKWPPDSSTPSPPLADNNGDNAQAKRPGTPA